MKNLGTFIYHEYDALSKFSFLLCPFICSVSIYHVFEVESSSLIEMSTNQSNETPFVTQEQLNQVLVALQLNHQYSHPPPRYNSVPPEQETFLQVDNEDSASGPVASAHSVTESVRSSERSLPAYPPSWDSSGIGPTTVASPTWEQYNEVQLKFEQLQRENQRQK